MFDFAAMLKDAQDGAAAANLARQFGLTPDQATKALDAMAPAFAAAMQRQMTDPQAFGSLMGMLTGDSAMKPYRDALAAFSPETTQFGNEALGQLFGSSDVSKAVADRLAAMTGLGQNVLAAMLPTVAAMLMGGLGASLQGNPFGAMMTQMFGGGRPPASLSEAMERAMRSVPRATGETETVEAMLKRTPNPAGPASPFDETIGEFIRGFNRGRPEPDPEPDASAELAQMFGQMLKAGQDAQTQQVQAFGEMLDRFWGKR